MADKRMRRSGKRKDYPDSYDPRADRSRRIEYGEDEYDEYEEYEVEYEEEFDDDYEVEYEDEYEEEYYDENEIDYDNVYKRNVRGAAKDTRATGGNRTGARPNGGAVMSDGRRRRPMPPQPNMQDTPKKKRNPFFLFLRVLLITVASLFFMCFVIIFAYNAITGEDMDMRKVAEAIKSNLKKEASFGDLFSGVPEHTNFALFGTDEDGTRTDVVMVGNFNSKSKEVTLISIPRDTYTVMPKERINILKEQGLYVPSDGIMKFNAVHHYAGKKFGVDFAVKQLEEMLDIKIEYYAKVDLDAFVYLIDEMGGVEFDVPQRYYYTDPTQDLYIDLQPGLQTLTGKQAEGLVRYRKADLKNPISKGLPGGDVDRVVIQQAFMKAMISQLVSKDNFMKNAPAMFNTFVDYMETNLPPTDVPKYAAQLDGFNMSKIKTYTIPGYGGNKSPWYYYIDEEKTKELVDQVFNTSYDESAKKTEAPEISSVGKRIQILNGGYTKGLAGSWKEKLTEKGFSISAIGDYSGTKKEKTRIIVREDGMGNDLLALFEGAEIKLDNTIDDSYDIIIVLGTEQK